MKNFGHLVAFIADQIVDAISVAFDNRFAFAQLTLIGQAHELDDVEPTVGLLQSRLGVPVQVQPLVSPTETTRFKTAVRELLRQAGPDVVVNLNTEDAASACLVFDVARSIDVPVFAIDTRSDRLIWLAKPCDWPDLDLQDKLSCVDVFALHGYVVFENAPLSMYARKLACAESLLGTTLRDDNSVLRLLPRTGLTLDTRGVTGPLLRTLQEAGLITRTDHGRWAMTDPDAAAFLRGGWLEWIVFERLRRLADTLKLIDVRQHVQIKHSVSGQIVEFDIACMVNNQLHLIECKSGDSRGAKFISHLEGITRSHGLRARCLLVSVDTLSLPLQTVAQSMHITCIHGQQLAHLEDALRAWLVQAIGAA